MDIIKVLALLSPNEEDKKLRQLVENTYVSVRVVGRGTVRIDPKEVRETKEFKKALEDAKDIVDSHCDEDQPVSEKKHDPYEVYGDTYMIANAFNDPDVKHYGLQIEWAATYAAARAEGLNPEQASWHAYCEWDL